VNFVRAKTPWLVKKSFPDFVWDIHTKKSAKKTVYLTFDDGPTPDITEQVLDILKKYEAKATFFCIGKNIEKNPTIFNRILKEEHTIGNHTYNHLKGWESDTNDYLEDVEKTTELINSKISNQQSIIVNLFRPPYGQIKLSQAKQLQKLGYKIIMWDVLAIDWDDKISQKKILKNVVNNTKPGSIVVFHDSLKASTNMLYALPKTLDYFNKKGFVFKKIELK